MVPLELSSTRKREENKALAHRIKKSYDDALYANISMAAVLLKETAKGFDILTKLKNPETEIQYLTKSIINICFLFYISFL